MTDKTRSAVAIGRRQFTIEEIAMPQTGREDGLLEVPTDRIDRLLDLVHLGFQRRHVERLPGLGDRLEGDAYRWFHACYLLLSDEPS